MQVDCLLSVLSELFPQLEKFRNCNILLMSEGRMDLEVYRKICWISHDAYTVLVHCSEVRAEPRDDPNRRHEKGWGALRGTQGRATTPHWSKPDEGVRWLQVKYFRSISWRGVHRADPTHAGDFYICLFPFLTPVVSSWLSSSQQGDKGARYKYKTA